MTAPLLFAQIQGQGTVSADNLNTYIQNCTNIAQLRSFIGLPGMCVFIDGSVTQNDGGAGPFYWNPTSTGADNNSTIIVPQPGVAGAWIRLAVSQTSTVTITNITALRSFAGGAAVPVLWVEGYSTLADGGEGIFVYNPADTTSADNGGTIIVDSQNHRYYREYGKMPFNVCWFGADSTGVSDSAPALRNTFAALPTTGGQIFFPPGNFLFNSQVTYTIPSPQLSIALFGAGADVSVLFWPNSNGLVLNATSDLQSVHLCDLTISTGSATGFIGVLVTQSNPSASIFQQSDFTRVTFRGSTSSNYWNPCLAINGLSNISYDTCLFVGTGTNGFGVNLSGSSSSPFNSNTHNFSKCCFENCSNGILYGNSVGFVRVVECVFIGGLVGTTASNSTGIFQLSFIGCNFNTNQNQIVLQSNVNDLFVHDNQFFMQSGLSAILFTNSSSGVRATISGNTFLQSSPTGTGVNFSNNSGTFTFAVITGNVFYDLATGVNLFGAASSNVQANVYGLCTTTVANIGGNSVGAATQ